MLLLYENLPKATKSVITIGVESACGRNIDAFKAAQESNSFR